jgi:hypothetical protein
MSKERDPLGWLIGLIVVLGVLACIAVALKSPPKSRSVIVVQ